MFAVATDKGAYRAHAVLLALGRTGTPRKLGVPGEELPKVMYRLIEADHYINKNILIVGGGDSAVEAAMGLARQTGNKVTLSYRKDSFSRIKERNVKRIEECMRSGQIRVAFNSMPVDNQGTVGLAGGQRSRRRNSERLCLGIRRRHSAERLLETDRRGVRHARHHFGGGEGGPQSPLRRATALAPA